VAAYDQREVEESGKSVDPSNALEGLKPYQDTQLSAVYSAQNKQRGADAEVSCQMRGREGMLTQPWGQEK
jgi:hypothetical protein